MIMKIKKKLLLGLLILCLAVVSEFVVGALSAKTGGTSDYASFPSNKFSFIVNQNSFDNSYYKTTGIFSFWTLHSSPVNCGNGSFGCVCNLPAFTDPNEVNKSGWPIYNTYSHGVCGAYITYLPAAIIVDLLIFILVYLVVIVAIQKLLHSSSINRQRLNSSNK
jgi:hypothetical protein